VFDGKPWAVEHGATIPAAVARAAHYAATKGRQGVTRPGDLKVAATPSASQGVRIGTGSATILNQQAPGESYQGLARTFTDVNVTVNGSARTDLVIGRIIDPDFAPWQPSDVPDGVNGPYWRPYVVPGVSSSTTKASDVVSYSAVELARIAVPASGNITNGMITDLRRVTNVDRERHVSSVLPTDTRFTAPPANGRVWFPFVNELIFCPEWATRAQIVVTVSSLLFDSGVYQGRIRAEYGWNGTTVTSLNTEDAGLDSPAARNRQTIMMATEVAIPEEFRGEFHYLRTGTITNGGITGRAVADDWTTIGVDVEFVGAAA